MRLLSILRLRFQSLFSRSTVERELDEELRYHVERQIDEEVARGRTVEEARYAAVQSFKNVEQRKEECRDMRGLAWLDHGWQDGRFALRQLRQCAGFTFTAVSVLALGIASAITIFAFVEAALIRPLPYREESRLVAVFQSSPAESRGIVSYLNFMDWKRMSNVFSSLEAFALNGSFTLTSASAAEQVHGTRVTAGFFHALGVTPVLGRDFRPGEDQPEALYVAILSYSAWQTRFAGKNSVIGRVINLNGKPTTIIGVLPPDFQFAIYGRGDFWGTLRGSGSCESERGCSNLMPIARLRDGISIETASAQMRTIIRHLSKEHGDHDVGGANLVPLHEFIVGDVQPILLALLTGAVLLLLISAVNVAALVLARSDKRQREMAVRAALGASEFRLARQLATEALVLVALSGSLAAVLATWAMQSVPHFVPAAKVEHMPFLRDIHWTPLTASFGGLTLLFATFLLATLPLTRSAFLELPKALKEGARGSGATWRRLGSNLVVAEIAIATILMASAGLLARSLYLLLHVDTGFQPDHVLAIAASWAPGRYATDPEMIRLEQRILDDITRVPGVESVAISNAPPIDSAWGTTSFHVFGRPNHGETNEVLNRHVSASYFHVLGARLLRGRYFNRDDNRSSPPVAVINRTVAQKYFGRTDPISKQIYYDWQPRSPMQIVGVVDDIREGPLAGAAWPAVYVPFTQTPWAWPAVLIRTRHDELSLIPDITKEIHRIDPLISVSDAIRMTDRIAQSPAAYLHRSAAWLVGAFASSAFVLTVIGLYGVVAYSVAQRTREIGIRMAFGADKTAMRQLILKDTAMLTGIGLLAGLAISLPAMSIMRALLFGVHPWDIPTLASVAAMLSLAAVLAGYIPARRAASVNPIEALRAE